MEETIYQKKGFVNRKAYLKDLAEQYGISFGAVCALASMLGPDEDFDGLVSACEDADEMNLDI